MSQVECYFVSWLSTDKDLREIWKDMNEQLNIAFRHYNNYQWKEGYPKFFINDEEIPEMYIKNELETFKWMDTMTTTKRCLSKLFIQQRMN